MLITRKYTFGDGTVRYIEEEVEEQISYTADQLAEMSSTELKAICVELGIPTSMVKQNMIDLILGKQNSN